MNLRKEYHTAVFHSLSQMTALVDHLENSGRLKFSLDHAPVSLVRSRSFKEIVFDDAMNAFEDIMKDVPDQDIPVSFYLQMVRARGDSAATLQDADKKLKAALALKRAPSAPRKKDPVPDFLKVIVEDAQINIVAMLANNWGNVLKNFGRLAMSGEALAAVQTAEIRLKTMALEVNQSLAQRKENLENLEEMLEQDGKTARRPGAALPAPAGMPDMRLQQLLSLFGEDLTEKARRKELPAVIAREDETRQVLAAVMQQDNPYALSIGRTGAGKSAVTAALARKIADGDVPAKLKNARLVHLRLKDMKANSGQGQRQDPRTGETSIVDQFNERLYYILSRVAEHNRKGGQQIILNISELGDMAGRIPSFFQARDVLSSVMDVGGLRLVGEISEQKFNQLETEAADLLGRFHRARIAPLDAADTIEVLKTAAARTKKETGVETPADLMDRIVKLSSRYLPALAQPAAALDTMEAAVAYAEVRGRRKVCDDDVVDVVSSIAGVPKEFIGSSMSERISTLGEALPKMVMGQDEAIKDVVASLKIANANMQDPNKPLGSFLMVGPTGVGKTETAKALAAHLGVPLITEDMGSYQDQHAKAKLIGAPPGYVGFDKEAALEKVAKSPYCVLLLDEIEKAHNDVFNILLSVLDEGRLQLMNGKTIDFKNCIVLMSSNLGARDAENARDKRSFGFGGVKTDGDAEAGAAYLRTIEDRLPPEFINRLDGILKYNRLADAVVRKIAARKVEQVSAFLTDKNRDLRLELSPEAMEDLFSLGYDPRYGARPMDRAVKKYIKQPLADWFIENGAGVTEPTTLYVKGLKNGFDHERRATRPPSGNGPQKPAPSP